MTEFMFVMLILPLALITWAVAVAMAVVVYRMVKEGQE